MYGGAYYRQPIGESGCGLFALANVFSDPDFLGPIFMQDAEKGHTISELNNVLGAKGMGSIEIVPVFRNCFVDCIPKKWQIIPEPGLTIPLLFISSAADCNHIAAAFTFNDATICVFDARYERPETMDWARFRKEHRPFAVYAFQEREKDGYLAFTYDVSNGKE